MQGNGTSAKESCRILCKMGLDFPSETCYDSYNSKIMRKGRDELVFEALFGDSFMLGTEEEERFQEQEKEKACRIAAFFKDNIAEDWNLNDPREDDDETY